MRDFSDLKPGSVFGLDLRCGLSGFPWETGSGASALRTGLFQSFAVRSSLRERCAPLPIPCTLKKGKAATPPRPALRCAALWPSRSRSHPLRRMAYPLKNARRYAPCLNARVRWPDFLICGDSDYYPRASRPGSSSSTRHRQ